MDDDFIAPPDWSFDAVLLERNKAHEANNPRIGHVNSTILKEGPPVWKVASYWEVLNEYTRELHHHAFRLNTYRHYVKGWREKPEFSASLEDREHDEIERLVTFLGVVRAADLPDARGDYIVVPVKRNSVSESDIVRLLSLATAADKAGAVSEILAAVKDDAEAFERLMASTRHDPTTAGEAVATLNLARFTAAIEQLDELIHANAVEHGFQALLQANPWMFGSEYSQLLDRRVFTRDKQQDFMLRRTADNYLELIEIKRPLAGVPLFKKYRNTLAPDTEMSEVLGQVLDYLEQLDADQHRIHAVDRENVNKIRAKIIIGTDVNTDQVAALRRLNGHLHRVEILTFDQLRRIAAQVLTSLQPGEAVSQPDGDGDEMPDFDNMPF